MNGPELIDELAYNGQVQSHRAGFIVYASLFVYSFVPARNGVDWLDLIGSEFAY